MNLIDSSCWIEYFAGTDFCKSYTDKIEQIDNVIVPAIVIYEVFKKLLTETNESKALIAIAHMQLGKVIDIDSNIAMLAAKLSLSYKIPMADSLILAVSRKFQAKIYTHDEHFSHIKDVIYIPKN